MMKVVLRIVVGIIFIVSGVVKAVDPVGFSFKMEEYFSPAVFNMPFFEKFALPIAIFVSCFEVVLGLMLLLKIKLKTTLISLILLCVFFAFLTFYSAYFNVVTDCGCFGDAVKFTPWQSFWKDIALLMVLLILWFGYKKHFESSASKPIKSAVFGLGILFLAFVVYKGISSEPVIDFRDYKIGTNLLSEREKIKAQPSDYKTFYVLKNKQTGEEKKVNQDDYVNDETLWKEGTPWEIQKDKTTSEIVKQGYQSEIAKFKLIDSNGMDITEEILRSPKAVLVFSYKPENVSVEKFKEIEQKLALQKDASILGVSTNGKIFKTVNNATMDGTTIKTIARSNPFVLTLQSGKIIDKQPVEEFLTH